MKTLASGALAAVCVVVLAALPAGCSKSRKNPPVEPGPASTYPTGGTEPAPGTTADDKWDRLYDQVPGKDRVQQCLGYAQKANDAFKEMKRATGAEREAAMERAKEFKIKAGDLYDFLREDVEDIDPDLWGRRFYSFDRRYDRLMKPLSRLGF